MPKEIKQCSDDELAISMLVFMQEQGAERMLRATAKACEFMKGKELAEASTLIREAAELVAHGHPNAG